MLFNLLTSSLIWTTYIQNNTQNIVITETQYYFSIVDIVFGFEILMINIALFRSRKFIYSYFVLSKILNDTYGVLILLNYRNKLSIGMINLSLAVIILNSLCIYVIKSLKEDKKEEKRKKEDSEDPKDEKKDSKENPKENEQKEFTLV